MQDLAGDAALAYDASVVLRIGSAVVSGRASPVPVLPRGRGVRSVWRHLRGSEIHPRLLQEAEEANGKLWEQASALPLPEEFLAGYRDLAAATLAHLDRDEAMSRDEIDEGDRDPTPPPQPVFYAEQVRRPLSWGRMASPRASGPTAARGYRAARPGAIPGRPLADPVTRPDA